MDKPFKGRRDGHLFDYSEITEQIYIGSDLCRGMVCPVHGPEFETLGILVEVNLSVEKKEIPPDGIDVYAWIPTPDGYPPSQEQLDMGTAIIDAAVKGEKKVYVHCSNGHGRSPTLVAAYFIRFQGKSPVEAEAFIKEKRAEIHIEENQMEALREFERRWSR